MLSLESPWKNDKGCWGEKSGLMKRKRKHKNKEVDKMGKISAFIVGTIGLSLALLIPVYLNFQIIEAKLQEIGVLSKVFPNFWQGFALIVFVVVLAVGTLMALIVFGGEKNVVR